MRLVFMWLKEGPVQRILNGLQRFQNEVFPKEKQLFEKLASSQSPEALFLTCSDSRVVPDLLMQTKPGDLFICRNAGNIAPPFGEVNGGVSATIEYAVMVLNVNDIIICGHSDCGAMRGLLEPSKVAAMPNVAAWLRHAERARFVVRENYPDLDAAGLLAMVTEQNVIAQIENLRTHPCVASRIHRGQLNLHGWVYHIETGLVTVYEPGSKRFVPMGQSAGQQADVVSAHAGAKLEASHA
jgi:carbonic anhydrase